MLRQESALRSEDVALSNNIYDFLDNNFYTPENVTSFERVLDKQRQVKGVDVIFTMNGKQYVADEKAAVRYRNLKTYSLELSFINRANEVQDGWLIKEGQINNAYVFTWIDEDEHTGKESVTLAVVTKEKLQKHLDSLGWTKENLIKKSKLIRESTGYVHMGNMYHDNCKFTYSEKYVEKPINILLPRDAYMKIADKVWTKEL